MRYLLALVAMVAALGFSTFVHAEGAAKPAKPKKGRVVKVEASVLSYNGGVKGKGKEYTVKTDDKTKVTIEGKDGKLADLKPEMYVEVTAEKGVATLIAASAEPPKAADAGKAPEKPAPAK